MRFCKGCRVRCEENPRENRILGENGLINAMNGKLCLLFALIGISLAVKIDQEVEWQQWKTKYSRSYVGEAEESVRKLVWQDNWLFVKKHNSENHTFTVELNEFADLVRKKSNSHSPRHSLTTWLSIAMPGWVDCRDAFTGLVTGSVLF